MSMSTNSLVVTVEATHRSLEQRLGEVMSVLKRDARARESYCRTDAFMAAASRHLGAAEEVLVPEACRRLEDGREMAKEYIAAARRLEASIARLRGRLYGELHAAHLPWAEVWTDLRRSLAQHNDAERRLVDRLSTVVEHRDADDLAVRVYRAELKAPTRAHPYLPHTGRVGVAARRIWAAADRFWDAAQNRTVPPPIRPKPKDREHESLMSQFLRGGPTLDPEAPVIRHGERRHGARHRGGVPERG
jgi:hypothetical protein